VSEIEQIIDECGEVRRLGSLMPPAGFVSAFNTFESEKPLWDDNDIRKVLSKNLPTCRDIFGPEWVHDQKSHGSCNGYAGAGALQAARWMRGIRDKLKLSGAYLYSKINGGADNGSALEDGLRAVQQYGIAPADLVTWDMIYPREQPKTANEEAAKHKGFKCYAVQTKQGFRTAVAAGFPVIVAVHAGANFQRPNSAGIVKADNGRGNHAVFVLGAKIINGTECYDLQNSWNTRFGTDGRVYATWDSFEQTFGNHTVYAVASTDDAGVDR